MWEVETNWRWGVHVETFICKNQKIIETIEKYRIDMLTMDWIKMTLCGSVHWF